MSTVISHSGDKCGQEHIMKRERGEECDMIVHLIKIQIFTYSSCVIKFSQRDQFVHIIQVIKDAKVHCALLNVLF